MPFLHPALCRRRITDLTVDELRICSRLPVRLLLLDVDNTLSRHGEKEPAPGVGEWVHRMEQAGFRLLILSNNTKKRVAPFAAKLGLPFLSCCAKPLPLCYLLACHRMGVKRQEAVLIGDQIFTDVLGGCVCHMATVLLEPIEEETGWSFRLRRKWEEPYRQRFGELDHQNKNEKG
ncbi:MAG TPA: YqeG family HAD IIIA-type phosphatase [Firmicutes bacterium]|nr:YqeG family HAD IIIA-type phosphatase [Bacillota bacterium]